MNATLRTAFVIAIVFTVTLIFFTVRATGSNRDLIRYTGRWGGGFTIDSVQSGPDSEAVRKRNKLTGYVQIYLTGRKYTLHLEGEQQGVDVYGTWTAKGEKLTLTPKEVKIDDRGGPEQRDPNRPYLPNEDVRAAYERPIVLSQSADKNSFQGLPMSVSRFIGKHRFEK